MTIVYYIGGWGRSGSTLLGTLLNKINGCIYCGELTSIWGAGFVNNQLCSCGKPFRSCPFWVAVVEDAFGNFDNADTRSIKVLKRSIEHIRTIPQIVYPQLRTSQFATNIKVYTEMLEQFYTAIKRIAGCNIIVDSSKIPTYGFVLSQAPHLKVFLVHLVRDSRAVAYSWTRSKRRPDVCSSNNYMPIYSYRHSAAEWMLKNLLTHSLAHFTTGYQLLRYEDLISDPKLAVTLIQTGFPCVASIQGVTEQDDKAVHAMNVNPSIFESRSPDLIIDNEWVSALSKVGKAQVTALTYPLLRQYGYSL